MKYKPKKWNLNEFYPLYESGLSDLEIAKKLNVSDRVINSARNALELPSNKHGISIPLSDIQKEVIIGCLLGDGYINSKSSVSGMFVMGHSITQEKWLLQKTEWLGNLINRKPYYIEQIRKGTVNKGIYIYTRACKELKEIHSIFYKDGIKIIPKNIGDYFSKLSLAVLYQDDGYCHYTHNGKYSTCYISTCAFDEDSINNLILLLKNKFDINSTLQKCNNVIAIAAKSKSKFIEIIKPFIIEDMKYKIPESL